MRKIRREVLWIVVPLVFVYLAAICYCLYVTAAADLIDLLEDNGIRTLPEASSNVIELTNDYIEPLMYASQTHAPLKTMDAVGTQAAQQTATVSTPPSPNPTLPNP